jgi:hypothetical protein
MSCCKCLENSSALHLLAKRCTAVSVAVEKHPTLCAVITVYCVDGRKHVRTVFPGCGQDWAWVMGITNNCDSQRCGVMLPLTKAA